MHILAAQSPKLHQPGIQSSEILLLSEVGRECGLEFAFRNIAPRPIPFTMWHFRRNPKFTTRVQDNLPRGLPMDGLIKGGKDQVFTRTLTHGGRRLRWTLDQRKNSGITTRTGEDSKKRVIIRTTICRGKKEYRRIKQNHRE